MKESKYPMMYSLLKYAGIFGIFCALGLAEVSGIRCFAFGMFFALVWCNQKVQILAPLYVISTFVCTLDYISVIGSVIMVVIMCVMYMLHYKFKRPMNLVLISLYAILGILANSYLNVYMGGMVVSSVLGGFFGLIAMLCYIHFLQNIMLYGLRRKYQVTEVISGGVMLMLIINGINHIPVLGMLAVDMVVGFGLLLVVWMFGTGAGVMVGLISGLGVTLNTSSLIYVAIYGILGMVAGAMQSKYRVYSVLSVFLVNVLLRVYFLPIGSMYEHIAMLVGCVVFWLIPKKALENMGNLVITERENNAISNLLNKERTGLYSKLKNLSSVFLEMRNAFLEMAKKNITKDVMIDAVVQDVKYNTCANCPNKSTCLRTFDEETQYALSHMAEFGIDRGKVNIIDVPSVLSCRCTRIGAVLNEVNKKVMDYKDKQSNENNASMSKLIIADQLFGVSQVMCELAESVASRVDFDESKEREIMEKCNYNNILCIECVVYKVSKGYYYVSATIRTDDIIGEKLVEIAMSVLEQPMQIAKIEESKKPGFSIVNMQIANSYEMVFGTSGAKKYTSKESGDTHSVTRIGMDKYLVVLSDGKGSGKDAEKNSTLAINLIENFYQAGFDSDVTIDSVNKLLLQNGDEDFSAVDIAVVDLKNGNCDMYKVGSPCSFVKNKDSVQYIEAGALPLGILEEIRPSVSARILGNNDMLILFTDGVLDAFKDEILLRNYIEMCNTTNPQTLADAILNEALKLNSYAPEDDMTVMVAKLYRS